jgi:hypothetical protein
MQTGRFLRELTRSCESVWRVAFKDDRAVVLCQRGGGTALEIISFRPEDEKRTSQAVVARTVVPELESPIVPLGTMGYPA